MHFAEGERGKPDSARSQMLPLLANLRLTEDATGMPEGAGGGRKRPDGPLPGPASLRAEKRVRRLEGVTLPLGPDETVQTLLQEANGACLFSAIPGGGIYAFRYDPTATQIKFKDEFKLVEPVALMIEGAFSNKPSKSGDIDTPRGRCGSFNCFYRVVLDDNNDAHMAIRAMIVAMFASDLAGTLMRKGINAFPFAAPLVVTIRTPKRVERRAKEVGTLAARDELALTLRLAARGLAPAVLCAVPMIVKTDAGAKSHTGFCYIGEDGWYSLNIVLRSVATPQDELALGSALVRAFEGLSEEGVLLFDVKSKNMVARKNGDAFDVRFIDFGAEFSVDANKPTVRKTSTDCVLVVNALLFLNGAMQNHIRHEASFRALAKRVVVVWRTIKRTANLSAFCALLDRDQGFAGGRGHAVARDGENVRHIPYMSLRDNLNDVDGDAFLAALRQTFYTVMLHYSFDPLTAPEKVTTELYMDAIVVRLQNAFSLPDGEVDAAVEDQLANGS